HGELLLCDGREDENPNANQCKFAAHPACYKTNFTVPEGDFFCDRCKAKITRIADTKVICCDKKDDFAVRKTLPIAGLLGPTFVHVLCAIWNPEVGKAKLLASAANSSTSTTIKSTNPTSNSNALGGAGGSGSLKDWEAKKHLNTNSSSSNNNNAPSSCAVCDEHGELLLCDGREDENPNANQCKFAAHPACYKTNFTVPEGDFFCDRCKAKITRIADTKVICCDKKDDFAVRKTLPIAGLLGPTFVHVLCAIWNPEVGKAKLLASAANSSTSTTIKSTNPTSNSNALGGAGGSGSLKDWEAKKHLNTNSSSSNNNNAPSSATKRRVVESDVGSDSNDDSDKHVEKEQKRIFKKKKLGANNSRDYEEEEEEMEEGGVEKDDGAKKEDGSDDSDSANEKESSNSSKMVVDEKKTTTAAERRTSGGMDPKNNNSKLGTDIFGKEAMAPHIRPKLSSANTLAGSNNNPRRVSESSPLVSNANNNKGQGQRPIMKPRDMSGSSAGTGESPLESIKTIIRNQEKLSQDLRALLPTLNNRSLAAKQAIPSTGTPQALQPPAKPAPSALDSLLDKAHETSELNSLKREIEVYKQKLSLQDATLVTLRSNLVQIFNQLKLSVITPDESSVDDYVSTIRDLMK
ncbi:UNVERIFIED_CONTAM: hypothetical protein HDU68_001022, partial [Siphonaria sp. JEL0065]